jgi:hypothetical protein
VPNFWNVEKSCYLLGMYLKAENCLYILFGKKHGKKSRQTDQQPMFVVKQLRADDKRYSSKQGAWERR